MDTNKEEVKEAQLPQEPPKVEPQAQPAEDTATSTTKPLAQAEGGNKEAGVTEEKHASEIIHKALEIVKSDQRKTTGKGPKGSSSSNRSAGGNSCQNGDSLDLEEYDDLELEEPFSDTDDDEMGKPPRRPHLNLPMPRRRIRTLSGTLPPSGYSPVWGGPTMCLGCLEFFDLPKQTEQYVEHLLEKHRIVITDIALIVDLKRYVEHWRHRFGKETIENIFPKVTPTKDDSLYGKVKWYYLMSELKVKEDRDLRERLAMRRLEEVLYCQQREREDASFNRQCLFCRYRAKGNRSKIIHHLYMIHHLNLGSPDNLVFVNEYLDLLKSKLDKNQCLYCEKIFPEHTALMEHMRKRQHREVNPKNSYYDKFYVINFLELGKKWLDVLAEDFEDTMPTFADSDEDEEDESWHEWIEDNLEEDLETLVVCLICDQSQQGAQDFLDHMKKEHSFDLMKLLNGLEFYERVKLVNYIRKLSYNCICWLCEKDDLHSWQALRKHLMDHDHITHHSPDKAKWDKEEYLVPMFENDHLLWVLESLMAQKEKQDVGASGDTVGNGDDQAIAKAVKVELVPNVYPEDLPELHSVLEDKELREQLQ